MTTGNFFENLASSTYSFFAGGTSAVLKSVQGFTQSIQEIQLVETKYVERIQNISSIIAIQQSEVDFLEKHQKTGQEGAILKEINHLKAGLEKLAKEKAALQAELDRLKDLEQKFEHPIDQTPPGLKTLKKTLKETVANGELSEAMSDLLGAIKEDSPLHDDLILFSARFNSLEQQQQIGLISIVEFGQLQNNIIYGFLALINKLEEKDLTNVV